MGRPVELTALIAVFSSGLILLGACAAVQPEASPRPQAGRAGASATDHEKTEQARRKRQLERRLEVAQLRLAQCQIANEHEKLRHQQRLARAETAHELARRRLEVFMEMTTPIRLARAELTLRLAEDELVLAQEETERLQRELGAHDSADAQQVAALERASRAQERQQREVEIQREELRVLREVLLPLEAMELQLEADRCKQAVLELHWDNEAALLDRRMALLEAEAQVERLEQELADLVRQVDGGEMPAGGVRSE